MTRCAKCSALKLRVDGAYFCPTCDKRKCEQCNAVAYFTHCEWCTRVRKTFNVKEKLGVIQARGALVIDHELVSRALQKLKDEWVGRLPAGFELVVTASDGMQHSTQVVTQKLKAALAFYFSKRSQKARPNIRLLLSPGRDGQPSQLEIRWGGPKRVGCYVLPRAVQACAASFAIKAEEEAT